MFLVRLVGPGKVMLQSMPISNLAAKYTLCTIKGIETPLNPRDLGVSYIYFTVF